MAYHQYINTTAVLYSFSDKASAISSASEAASAWDAASLAVTCTWLAVLLWGDAASSAFAAASAAVSPYVTPAAIWAKGQLCVAGHWLGLWGAQLLRFALRQCTHAYHRTRAYLASVDPIVWRQMAVVMLWLVGLALAYKWMQRRGYFRKMHQQYRKAVDRVTTKYRQWAEWARKVRQDFREKYRRTSAFIARCWAGVCAAAHFMWGLPRRGYDLLCAQLAAVRARLAAAYDRVKAGLRAAQNGVLYVCRLPGVAWRRVRAAAGRVRDAIRGMGTAICGCRDRGVQQCKRALVFVGGRPKYCRDLAVRVVYSTKGYLGQRCRDAAELLQRRYEEHVQPLLRSCGQYVELVQSHVLYWALVMATMWLLPGGTEQVLATLFHGPWVVDYLWPMALSIYSIQSSGNAAGPQTHQYCLKYWVVFFNLRLFAVGAPEMLRSRIAVPTELHFFFVLWLQLPFTNGVRPLYAALVWLMDRYVRKIPQPTWQSAMPATIGNALKGFKWIYGGWIGVLIDMVTHGWHLVSYCVFFFTPGFLTVYGCLLAGIVLPSTSTISTLLPVPEEAEGEERRDAEARQAARREQWLVYWMGFGAVHVVFYQVLIPWLGFLPMLMHVQLLLIVVLQLPYQIGAKQLPGLLMMLGRKSAVGGAYLYSTVAQSLAAQNDAKAVEGGGESGGGESDGGEVGSTQGPTEDTTRGRAADDTKHTAEGVAESRGEGDSGDTARGSAEGSTETTTGNTPKGNGDDTAEGSTDETVR